MQTVLVINDSPEFLELMREVLTDAGYVAETLGDGESALERVGEVRPSLIILDLVLGETDGWVVLTRLRADEFARDIPVILCSAAADRTRRHRDALMDAGVQVVEKPFDLDHLLDIIADLIGPAVSVDGPDSPPEDGSPASPTTRASGP